MAVKIATDEELQHIEAAIVDACLHGLCSDDEQDRSPGEDCRDAVAGANDQYTTVSSGG